MARLYICDQCKQPLNIDGLDGGSIVACPHCLWQITVPASGPIVATSVVGPRRSARRQKGISPTTVAAMIMAVVAFVFCGGVLFLPSGDGKPRARPMRAVKTGETGRIDLPPSEKMIICLDEEALDRLHKYVRAKDERGMMELVLGGKAFVVNGGTEVKVIDAGVLVHEVRVTEGPMEGRRGFVDREFVK